MEKEQEPKPTPRKFIKSNDPANDDLLIPAHSEHRSFDKLLSSQSSNSYNTDHLTENLPEVLPLLYVPPQIQQEDVEDVKDVKDVKDEESKGQQSDSSVIKCSIRLSTGQTMFSFQCYLDDQTENRFKTRFNGNCTLEGALVDGEPHGKIEYKYPDETYIQMDVDAGIFQSGIYFDPIGKPIKPLKLDLLNQDDMPEHKDDIDPYEEESVTVREAPGMGEGLFAMRKIESGNLVCFYSGILEPKSTVNQRSWDECAYALEYDSDL
jgi:hypothetical protein